MSSCVYPDHMIKYRDGRILERKENTILPSPKSKNIWGNESKVEGWTTYRQGWLRSGFKKGSSLRRQTSRICSRTSSSDGEGNREIFITNGSCPPQEWEQAGQQNREFILIAKSISTFKARTGTWNI